MSSHSQHSEAIEALKPKMLDWSRAQICGAPELLALVLNNRTDANKVGGLTYCTSGGQLMKRV